jgi:hypothetical protein
MGTGCISSGGNFPRPFLQRGRRLVAHSGADLVRRHVRSWRKLTRHPQPIRWSIHRNLRQAGREGGHSTPRRGPWCVIRCCPSLGRPSPQDAPARVAAPSRRRARPRRMIALPPSWFQTWRRQAQRRPDGRHVLQSSELSRVDRERLLAQGFVREVIKGWLISAIRLEDRDAYMKALESASIAADIRPCRR